MQQAMILQEIAEFWTKDMPFNQLLGFEITNFSSQQSEIRFQWQDKLIGNPIQKILHGGVTSAALDVAGGVVAAANIIEQIEDLSTQNIHNSLRKLGTIDLRTDFLRPGRGKTFIATAKIMRSGNKVAVTRMELYNEQRDHIACGTGTYMVG